MILQCQKKQNWSFSSINGYYYVKSGKDLVIQGIVSRTYSLNI